MRAGSVAEREAAAPPGTPREPRRFRLQRPTTSSLLLAVPAVLLTLTSIARFAFGRASIDLVVFDQGLWAASRGLKPMASVIRETLLEDHFGPGIFSFALLYRIVATPIWLLLAQGGAAWAAVRLIARRLEPDLGPLRSAAVGAALLVSPPVAYAVLFDVHSVVFAVPFALAAIFALEDGQPRRALLFGLAAALFRVEVGLGVAVAFAVWPGLRRGRLRPAALLWTYLVVAFHFEKALGHDSYWTIHYGYLGATTGAALAHPLRLVGAFVSAQSISKALPWLASGAFLAFRAPRRMIPAALLALPVLLSHWGGTKGIVFHYGFAPTLLLAPAWIPALRAKPLWSRHVIAACGVLALIFGPVVPAMVAGEPLRAFAGRYWVPQSEARCIGSGIPATAGVSARQELTFLAHRPHLYLWPYPFRGAPKDILPADYMAYGDPQLAAGVDYLLIPRADAGSIPPGFVADGQSPHNLRFRREATTSPHWRDCR
jgi:uncharacterized membrane protein